MPAPIEPSVPAGSEATVEVIDEARRTSFDHKAELYDAMRPSYPAALVDDLIARCAPQRMLEIGAGTGKATRVFARAGRELVAVEPGANLAAVLERNVAGFPHVTVERTTFEAYAGEAYAGEAYAGGGFDLIYAAQALHWIDPAVRYAKPARLLRPGGAFAAIFNEKPPVDTAMWRELDAVYARRYPEGPRPTGLDEVERSWIAEFDASGRFGPVQVERYPWTAHHSTRDYLALLDTYSDHATLAEDRRRALYADIAGAIDRHGGRIELPYVTLAFLAFVRAEA